MRWWINPYAWNTREKIQCCEYAIYNCCLPPKEIEGNNSPFLYDVHDCESAQSDANDEHVEYKHQNIAVYGVHDHRLLLALVLLFSAPLSFLHERANERRRRGRCH